MAEYRRLSSRERAGLEELYDTLENVRKLIIAAGDNGLHLTNDLTKFDDGAEVVRALITDTRSLVRNPDG